MSSTLIWLTPLLPTTKNGGMQRCRAFQDEEQSHRLRTYSLLEQASLMSSNPLSSWKWERRFVQPLSHVCVCTLECLVSLSVRSLSRYEKLNEEISEIWVCWLDRPLSLRIDLYSTNMC